MTDDIRTRFRGDLDKVQEGIVRMAAMVTESIPRATSALLNGDLDSAQGLIDGDDPLDELSAELDEECYRLLALEGPVAGDLRAVTTALRMNQEIERSGDLVVNVAKATRRIYGAPITPKVRGILAEMSEESVRLLDLAIDSYAERQSSLAAAIDDMDDRLDQLNYSLIEALLEQDDAFQRDIRSAVQLALVGRYYERIGDHAVNIGERVRYLVEGWSPEHEGVARTATTRGAARASLVEPAERGTGSGEGDYFRLRRALESLAQGIVVTDLEGRPVLRNGSANRFVNARHGGALVEAVLEELLGQARLGEPATKEVEWFGPPKQVFAVSATPLSREDGSSVGAIALVDDLSEIRNLEEMRKDFVANVSHELKTPAAALSPLAETLGGETNPTTAQELAERLSIEASRLTDTIDDLLELSRIEHEENAVREPVALSEIVQTVVDRVRAAADQRTITLVVSVPDEFPEIIADPTQVASAVFNLLDNAVKHSDPGSAVALEVGSKRDRVTLNISDSGPGIPREDLDRIFERFYRVDRSRARDTGGTGLGLSIVRHIMANHDGSVEVESVEGRGASFTLSFPVGHQSET